MDLAKLQYSMYMDDGLRYVISSHAEHCVVVFFVCVCLFCFFRNEFNTFNNTGARMFGSIYHMTLK